MKCTQVADVACENTIGELNLQRVVSTENRRTHTNDVRWFPTNHRTQQHHPSTASSFDTHHTRRHLSGSVGFEIVKLNEYQLCLSVAMRRPMRIVELPDRLAIPLMQGIDLLLGRRGHRIAHFDWGANDDSDRMAEGYQREPAASEEVQG